MASLPDAYPLQWPAGWPRTPADKRTKARYRISRSQARKDLLESIRLLGGKLAIVSSNIPLRHDGQPAASGNAYTASVDPGVAVYWVREGQQEVMACDRWSTAWDNLRAIFHAIEALRAMERAGATQILNRAFQAFQLTAGSAKPRWRDVLEYGDNPPDAGLIRACFKRLAVKLHPDVGGDVEKFRELEAAYREALEECR